MQLIEPICFAPITIENKFGLLQLVPVRSELFLVQSRFDLPLIWSDSWFVVFPLIGFWSNPVWSDLIWVWTDEHSYSRHSQGAYIWVVSSYDAYLSGVIIWCPPILVLSFSRLYCRYEMEMSGKKWLVICGTRKKL